MVVSSLPNVMGAMATEVKRGALIVLEGLDRSGKSSQSVGLCSFLQAQGVSVEAWRFPDRTTAMGQMISSYLSCKTDLDDAAIHLLFSANRWEKRWVPFSFFKSLLSPCDTDVFRPIFPFLSYECKSCLTLWILKVCRCKNVWTN